MLAARFPICHSLLARDFGTGEDFLTYRLPTTLRLVSTPPAAADHTHFDAAVFVQDR